MYIPIPNFTRADGTTIEGCPAVNRQYWAIKHSIDKFKSHQLRWQTKILTAQTGSYRRKSHIKLVLADDQLVNYDSAVFLQAGSFVSKIDLGQDKLIDTNNPVCLETITLSSNVTGPHKWTRTERNNNTYRNRFFFDSTERRCL
jgi:hypothetical protein